MKFQARPGTGVRRIDVLKSIVKDVSNPLLHDLLAVKGNGTAKVKLKQSQVVQTQHVIGVFMSKSDRVDHADLLPKQLSS
jgi:hypothetical protein